MVASFALNPFLEKLRFIALGNRVLWHLNKGEPALATQVFQELTAFFEANEGLFGEEASEIVRLQASLAQISSPTSAFELWNQYLQVLSFFFLFSHSCFLGGLIPVSVRHLGATLLVSCWLGSISFSRLCGLTRTRLRFFSSSYSFLHFFRFQHKL